VRAVHRAISAATLLAKGCLPRQVGPAAAAMRVRSARYCPQLVANTKACPSTSRVCLEVSARAVHPAISAATLQPKGCSPGQVGPAAAAKGVRSVRYHLQVVRNIIACPHAVAA
jgi:hypothetical protein